MAAKRLRVIPLGGLGEIGKNMMLLEYGENIIVIDAGIMFPEDHMLGVDLVLPDFSYLEERREVVRGVFLSHGHEDHIGGLPYLLHRVQAPVYATRLTLGLVRVKLQEHRLENAVPLIEVFEGDPVQLGPFEVEPYHVCHSIPDASGLIIRTPVGTVVHSGDYKFDPSPVDGRLTDFAALAEAGREGVLVLLADSTNAEQSGYTPSEAEITQSFQRVVAESQGRVVAATFASNISRVQQLIDVGRQFGRSIAVVGRSMERNVEMAQRLGYLRTDGALLSMEELRRLPREKGLVICTGSQGEPTSVLVRVAHQEHRELSLKRGDSVILSAEPIPGNEELVHHTLNALFRLGVRVYYDKLLPVHVSGHASRSEQLLLLNLVKPRYFVPIHGEYRHLVLHADMGRQMGIPEERIFILQNGDVLEVDEESAQVVGRVARGNVYVDGLGVGDVGTLVLRDRRHLSQDGFFIAVVTIDEQSGQVVGEPEIISRGFVFLKEADDLMEGAREIILRALTPGTAPAAAAQKVKDALSPYLYEQTGRRPMVLPVIMPV